MKNETGLAYSFIQDSKRDFYIPLRSDQNRILWYDTGHVIERGIKEYELNCFLTSIWWGRGLYFSAVLFLCYLWFFGNLVERFIFVRF